MSAPCPVCSRELVSQGVDADRGITRCTGCNALFELSSLAPVPGEEPPAPRARPRIPMRRWATVIDRPGLLELRVRRRTGRAWYEFGFGAAILAFLFSASRSQLPAEDPLWFTVFAVAFTSVGGWFAYGGLADLVGSTIVRLEQGRVRIRTVPLPRGRSIDLIASRLHQLYCVTESTHSDYGGPVLTYAVWAILENGSRIRLASPFAELDQALWLEQQIEQALGIRDVPVTGEASVWGTDRLSRL